MDPDPLKGGGKEIKELLVASWLGKDALSWERKNHRRAELSL